MAKTDSGKQDNEQFLEDSMRLAKLFREKAKGMSQEEFGARYDIGSQGMVWQLLNGKRPLNLKSAIGFSKGLGIPLEEISPEIARQVQEAIKLIKSGVIDNQPGTQEFPDYVSNTISSIKKAYIEKAPLEAFSIINNILNLVSKK